MFKDTIALDGAGVAAKGLKQLDNQVVSESIPAFASDSDCTKLFKDPEFKWYENVKDILLVILKILSKP